MKKILFVIGLGLCIANVFAQADNASLYASVIKATDLQKHLSVVAGAEMEGRETGTEGQRKAAAYIESQFKQIGLEVPYGMKSYQQYYPLYRDSIINYSLKIGDHDAVYGKDYIQGFGNTIKFTSKKIIFAGYGIEDKNYDDYSGINVHNKVVVIFTGEPAKDGKYLVSGTTEKSKWGVNDMMKKAILARKKGASGVLILHPDLEVFSNKIPTVPNRSLYNQKPVTIKKTPGFVQLTLAFARTFFGAGLDSIISKAKDSMAFSAADAWEQKIKTEYAFIKSTNIISASNVLGIIEGSDKKDEYVFLTGHYDHLGKRNGNIYYGADDDGSGTVAVIEMATAFAKAKAEGKGPRRTLVFMTVSGEEKGLWGSEYYTDHPVYPLDKTSVDLNTDMVGRIDTERQTPDTMNYVYVVGHDKLSSDLPVINEAANAKYTSLKLDYKFDDPKDPNRIYFRSDHYNFARKGVPVLFFYDGMLKADYHKPTDTIDKINWELYEKRVKMIFYTAWEMANRDDLLKRDIELPVQKK